MPFTLSGIVTDVSPWQSLKADTSIMVTLYVSPSNNTVEGMVTEPEYNSRVTETLVPSEFLL